MSIDLAAIRARDQAATPGPWLWRVNPTAKSAQLVSPPRGCNIVMAFDRWGMQRAQPRFNVGGILRDVVDLLRPEPGREHHANWHQCIAHPDADFIAHAREDIPALLAEVEHLAASCRTLLAAWDRIEEAKAGLPTLEARLAAIEPHRQAMATAIEQLREVVAG